MEAEDTVMNKYELEAEVLSCEIDTGSSKGLTVRLLKAQAEITGDTMT